MMRRLSVYRSGGDGSGGRRRTLQLAAHLLLAVTLLLAFTSATQAQDEEFGTEDRRLPIEDFLVVGVGITGMMDVGQTQYGLGTGRFQEGNPLAVGTSSPETHGLAKGVLTLPVAVYLQQLAKSGSGKQRTWALIGMGVLMGFNTYAVVHNSRQMR